MMSFGSSDMSTRLQNAKEEGGVMMSLTNGGGCSVSSPRWQSSPFCFLVFLLIVSLGAVGAFSSGAIIAKGPELVHSLYCGRKPLERAPFHMNTSCRRGFCEARVDTGQEFVVNVSDTVYWDATLNVTIRRQEGSLYNITGFAVSAVNDEGTVVGTFQDDDDVAVAICNEGVDVEGSTVFHAAAEHNRTEITLRWTGPKQNFNDIKFRVWIVHSYDVIFYAESEAISSQRNGSSSMNLPSTLSKLLGLGQEPGSNILDTFEDTFMLRQSQGYPADADDPFEYLRRLPRPHELIPGATRQSIMSLGLAGFGTAI